MTIINSAKSFEPTLSVLYGELVLSLYPILIKTVNTNLFTQILARFLVFPALAIAFGSTHDFSAIWGNPYEAFVSILHNFLNLGHIVVSYISFKNLSVGSAISLFYLYPIFNLIAGIILFKEPLSMASVILIAISFIGVYLIATSKKQDDNPNNTPEERRKHNWGVIMGILAAITETMIFIFIKSNTDAQVSPFYTVNHLYPAGLAVLLAYSIYNKNIVDVSGTNWLKLLAFNGILGFTGYIARFYGIPRIPILVFSLLSFFGVSFGYLWGILFTNEKPILKALLGSGLIVSSIGILRYFDIA
jgi:drug/metabolite transporter (DMT)-like permease